MQYRVGQDIMTSCGKCKQKTWHVVFAMAGEAVKRVQCKICLSYHNYHPDPEERQASRSTVMSVRRRREGEEVKTALPSTTTSRPVLEEDEAPAAAPGTRRTSSAPRRAKKEETPDYTELWNQAMKGKDLDAMVTYRADANYEEGGVVSHPSFGVGVVTKVSPQPEKRMQVLFQDGLRTMACRYGKS